MGKGAAIAAIAIVVVVVIVFAMYMNPGLPGKWEKVSETVTIGGTQISNWDSSPGDWIEFRRDGTGVTSKGAEFEWEKVDNQLKITGLWGVPVTLDYALNGRTLTLSGTLIGVNLSVTYDRM